MMNLSEYRRTATRLADYLPWAALVGSGVVLNKDGSFQRTAKFRGPDLDSAVAAELVAVAGRINNAVRRLGSGWSIFVEAQRSEAATYPDSAFPDAASALVDAERRAGFEEAGTHFVSGYFLTFLWLPPAEEAARAETWLYEGREKTGVDPWELLRRFIDRTDRVLALLDGFSLGDFPRLGLRAARDLAGWVRLQSSRGWDVEQIRAALKASDLSAATPPAATPGMVPFREVAKVWFERKKLGLKNGKHIDQNWNTVATYVFPTLGHRPIGEITRREVVDTIRPIWHEKHETARRTLGRVREIFELALLEHDVPFNPAVFEPNVAFGRVRRQTRHFGALPFDRMPEFWAWLQTAPCHEQTRQLVMALALSAKRTGETRHARAEFLSADGKVWTTPASLMKRARPHRVPLSRQLETVWKNALLLSDDPELLFGKRQNKSGYISENAAINLVKQFDTGITGHGFRSSFKGWARAQRRYAYDAIEFALAHRLPPLEEAYLREDLLEERAAMMQDWADYVCADSEPVSLADVALSCPATDEVKDRQETPDLVSTGKSNNGCVELGEAK